MTDELDGVLAFNNVLDRLLDAEVRARSAHLEVSDMRSQVEVLNAELGRAQKYIAERKAEHDRNLPKLSALWQQADELRGWARAQPNVPAKGIETLQKALADTQDACDQIPF
jgi:hypothetical protein